MSNVIDSVLSRLETILRYIAPGFVALFAAILIVPDFNPFQDGTNAGCEPWVASLGAVLGGVAIYSIHTSSVGRVFYRIAMWFHHRQSVHARERDSYYTPESFETRSVTGAMFDLDSERWRRRTIGNEETNRIQKELDKWGTLLNFLYCTSYPFMLIPFLVWLGTKIAWVGPNYLTPRWWVWMLVGALLLVFGVMSDYNIIKREFWAMRTYPSARKTKVHSR
jgi:hypothetical protein